MTAPKTVRWGFLGAGFVASRGVAPVVHAAAGSVLQVVASRDAGRAAALDPIRTVDSYEAVCTAEDVDIVYLSLPNDAHLRWVLAALEGGKHVLCEKPLGLTAHEVAEMTTAASEAGLLLVEGAWNRWHPRMRRFEALVAGAPGPFDVESWFTFSGVPHDNYRLDPARGGGALLDVGCYAVAGALAILGDDVATSDVECQVGPTGVDLTTTAVLSSPRGRAEVTASFERDESQGLRAASTELSVELAHPSFTSWREPATMTVVEDGVERVEAFEACDAYQIMVEAVASRARGDEAWVLPLDTSLEIARTLDAIVATTP